MMDPLQLSLRLEVLERAREAFRFHARIQALIDSGDKAQMEVEVSSLLREIDATQKHVAGLRWWDLNSISDDEVAVIWG